MRAPDSKVRRRLLTRAGLVLLLVAVAPATAPVAAQRPTEAENNDRARLEERIRARVAQIMRERLDLDAATEAALSETVREFEGRRRELSIDEREARRRIEELLEGSVPSSEAEALLGRIVELRTAGAELFREEQERLLQVLDPARVLEFYELRRELGQRIRAIRERRRDDDGPGRARPGGGVDGSALHDGHRGGQPWNVDRPKGVPSL